MKLNKALLAIFMANLVKPVGDLLSQQEQRKNPISNGESHKLKRTVSNDDSSSMTLDKKTDQNGYVECIKPASVDMKIPVGVYGYNMGDNAQTLDSFKSAVNGKYRIIANEKSKNVKAFSEGPIMVYGENHEDPLFPSIRNNKGVLLLESKQTEICLLNKYEDVDSFNCCFIDDYEIKQIGDDLVRKSAEIGLEMLGILGYRSESGKKPSLDDFGGAVYDAIAYVRKEATPENINPKIAGKPQIASKVVSLYNQLDDSFYKIEEFQKMNGKYNLDRESVMFKKASAIIENLPKDSSVTIIVGDNHAKNLFTQLEKKFNNRAVIYSQPKSLNKSRRNSPSI